MKYLIYARKSSESEERQAQSIEDQLRELRELAQVRGLTVVGELSESRSAKAPNARPVFSELLKRLQKGEADALLCWHVNRLFRNPVDFGTIAWLLQEGKLQEIHTPHQIYRSGDNVLLLSVENGMANQYILDLKKVVERGMRSKIEKGIPPQLAPEGYLNNLHTHTIDPDPTRFTTIRRAWDLMLTCTYTVPQVLNVLNEEWGYRTKAHWKVGGRPMSRAQGYRLFNNLFYTGYFLREGVVHKGSYAPMITMEEYERVRTHLLRHGSSRPRNEVHTYTGLIRCGRCESRITVEAKKGHLYYHCTNARGICNKRGIRGEELERQIKKELRSIQLNPKLEEILFDIVAYFERAPMQELHEQVKLFSRTLEAREEELSELVLMRARHLIDDATLTRHQTRLQGEIFALRTSLDKLHLQLERKHEDAVEALKFACNATAKFEGASLWTKREILQKLGGSYRLTEGKITLQKHPLLQYISENKGAIERAILAPEHKKEGVLQPSVSLGGTSDILAELFNLATRHSFTALTGLVSTIKS